MTPQNPYKRKSGGLVSAPAPIQIKNCYYVLAGLTFLSERSCLLIWRKLSLRTVVSCCCWVLLSSAFLDPPWQPFRSLLHLDACPLLMPCAGHTCSILTDLCLFWATYSTYFYHDAYQTPGSQGREDLFGPTTWGDSIYHGGDKWGGVGSSEAGGPWRCELASDLLRHLRSPCTGSRCSIGLGYENHCSCYPWEPLR